MSKSIFWIDLTCTVIWKQLCIHFYIDFGCAFQFPLLENFTGYGAPGRDTPKVPFFSFSWITFVKINIFHSFNLQINLHAAVRLFLHRLWVCVAVFFIRKFYWIGFSRAGGLRSISNPYPHKLTQIQIACLCVSDTKYKLNPIQRKFPTFILITIDNIFLFRLDIC